MGYDYQQEWRGAMILFGIAGAALVCGFFGAAGVVLFLAFTDYVEIHGRNLLEHIRGFFRK